MTYVIVKLPRAGLANKLLIWARACVYAKQHNLKLTTINWTTIHIGPIIRMESSYRLYINYFKKDGIVSRMNAWVHLLFRDSQIEPPINESPENKNVVVFNRILFWMHFFDAIRLERTYIKSLFLSQLLSEKYRQVYERLPSPVIGIHIRRGDFRAMIPGEKFDREVVLIQTPLTYFIEVVKRIRIESGSCLPVTIFSNGTDDELHEILSLESTQRYNGATDMEDLLALSKSKIVIPSPSSTFGLFAGYLSDGILLHHPDFYMRPLRDAHVNATAYEGPITLNHSESLPEQLKKQLIAFSND